MKKLILLIVLSIFLFFMCEGECEPTHAQFPGIIAGGSDTLNCTWAGNTKIDTICWLVNLGNMYLGDIAAADTNAIIVVYADTVDSNGLYGAHLRKITLELAFPKGYGKEVGDSSFYNIWLDDRDAFNDSLYRYGGNYTWITIDDSVDNAEVQQAYYLKWAKPSLYGILRARTTSADTHLVNYGNSIIINWQLNGLIRRYY